MDNKEVSEWNGFIKFCLHQYQPNYTQDDVQDMWVKLLEISGSGTHSNLKSYMRDVIKHHCIDESRKVVLELADMDTFIDEVPEPILDLNCLPNDELQIITSHFVEGMSYEQIAGKMGLSKDQVYRRKRKALQRLSGSINAE